jgi:hypothetical protein
MTHSNFVATFLLGEDLINDFGLPPVVKGRASRVKSLAHEPSRFVVEIGPGTDEGQNRCHPNLTFSTPDKMLRFLRSVPIAELEYG